MTRTHGRIIAGLVGLGIVVVSSIIKDADVYGFSAAVTSALVIVNGALAYLANWLPNVWHSEPAPLPGNPRGVDNP